MLRSLKLGQLFGIGIYVHWSFLLLPLWAVFMHLTGNLPNLGFYLVVLIGVFTCVVLHEMGHALTARCFDIDTRDITLYPIGGVARLERMSEKPWEELWIAVGGPAVNVILAVFFSIALTIAILLSPQGVLQLLETQTSSVSLLIASLLAANIVLILFNMIPAFPMDGGRVFRAILSMWMDRLQATRIAARVGMVLALFVAVGLFLATMQPLILFVMGFVIFAGQAELRYLEWRQRQAEEEDIPQVIPVRRSSHQEPAEVYPGYAHPYGPSDGLIFQPKISVYTWDSQTGAWVKESYSPSQ